MAILADSHDYCLPDSKILEKKAMSGRIAKFFIGGMQIRGPYQEYKSQHDDVVKKTIVCIEQYCGKSEKCDFCEIISLLRILQC